MKKKNSGYVGYRKYNSKERLIFFYTNHRVQLHDFLFKDQSFPTAKCSFCPTVTALLADEFAFGIIQKIVKFLSLKYLTLKS